MLSNCSMFKEKVICDNSVDTSQKEVVKFDEK